MTVDELKRMRVRIRFYATPEAKEPDSDTECYLSEALEIMKGIVEGSPEEFYELMFYVFTEEGEFLFALERDLEDIYFGRENKFNLERDVVREALGVQTKSIDELVQTLNEYSKVSIVSFPDPFEDSYHDYIHHCALKDTLQRMNKHLDELELDEKERLGYIFSVLLIAHGGEHRLIYSFDGDRNITVRKEFEEVLSKIGIRDSEVRYAD